MAKIERVSTLSADPNKLKIVTDDGLVYHIRKDGTEYIVGAEFETEEEHFNPTLPVASNPEVEQEVLGDFGVKPDEQADLS